MMGPLSYIGGKRRLARRLVALFPKHHTYVEPFAGGAQVFFCKEPSPVEILNDLDFELINFLRICQLHHDELLRYLRFAVASRKLFELYQRQDPTTLTDVQRAARFLFLQKNCFGGHVEGQQNYHYGVMKALNFNPETLPDIIAKTANRLARVQLECAPYEQILERFDRPDTTLFYLDPPYIGLKLYKFNFVDEDFRRLAERLAQLQGKFLLSINGHPLAREVFGAFNVAELPVVYTASRTVPTVTELIFSNYELPAQVQAPSP